MLLLVRVHRAGTALCSDKVHRLPPPAPPSFPITGSTRRSTAPPAQNPGCGLATKRPQSVPRRGEALPTLPPSPAEEGQSRAHAPDSTPRAHPGPARSHCGMAAAGQPPPAPGTRKQVRDKRSPSPRCLPAQLRKGGLGHMPRTPCPGRALAPAQPHCGMAAAGQTPKAPGTRHRLSQPPGPARDGTRRRRRRS